MGEFTLRDDGWPLFREKAIPNSGDMSYWNEVGLEPGRFVTEANALFEKYGVSVPGDFPAKCEVKDSWDARERHAEQVAGLRHIADELERAAAGGAKPPYSSFEALRKAALKALDTTRTQHVVPWEAFAEAMAFCILIENEYRIPVKSLLDDLIDGNSREGILHAATVAAVVLHCLRGGTAVKIVPRKRTRKTPDLLLGGVSCDLKVAEESDKTFDVDWGTGKGTSGRLSDDLCFNIGTFLSRAAGKGMAQADLVLADLSRKSMGLAQLVDQPRLGATGTDPLMNAGLPPPQPHRIVFFARRLLTFTSTFMDIDPTLWRLVRENRVSDTVSVIALGVTAQGVLVRSGPTQV